MIFVDLCYDCRLAVVAGMVLIVLDWGSLFGRSYDLSFHLDVESLKDEVDFIVDFGLETFDCSHPVVD